MHTSVYRSVIYVAALFLLVLQGCGEAFDADNTITIRGQINSQSGEPLNAALVEITSPPELQQTTQTDSTGNYLFTLESEETANISIQASKETFQTQTKTVSAEPGTDLSGIIIELAADTTGSDDGNGDDGGIDGPGAAAITLSSSPPQSINIAQTGEQISTSFTFQVQDSAGNPLSASKAVEVQFKLLSSPGGEEKLIPNKATTNDQGQVTTTLYSGNKAGELKLQAVIAESELGFQMKSSPVLIAIHGGFPDLAHFSLSREQKNIEGFDINNLTVPISVIIGDEFSNPVKPGTIVYFETTGGVIQGSGKTDESGRTGVELTSANPRPANGRVTVTASTVNKNDERIQRKVDVIFSTSAAAISAGTTQFTLRPSESKRINYTVQDLNGNPMAEGTRIVVEANEGIQLSGDTNITLGDYLASGPGKTGFSFTATDDGTSKKENIEIIITATSPSGKTTTFTDIKGTRIIEGSEQVGAAAIVLTQQPPNAININETGDEVSAPLTFQVRDSLGRPLTSENAVDVQFSLVSSPGGGEDLVPSVATTDGQGNVTTTLFSGNRAGEVKVQALIERPEAGLTIKSSPVLIAIHGGFPDKNHFSIAPDKQNFEGFNINNNRNKISVVLGDKFSNPVKPGTVVYFETTGGIIQGSGTTDKDGIVEVDLISGDPRPADGLATITASTVNSDNVRIQKQFDVIFSTSRASISSNPTTFNLPPNGGASFDYTVTDLNGNPMPAGTQIGINAGDGIEVTGDANFTLGDYLYPGPGATEFQFSIRDTDDENNDPAALTIQITVTTPSGETTTYSGIQGTRSSVENNQKEVIIMNDN